MNFLDGGGKPCGINLCGFYSRVVYSFRIGFDDQIFCVTIPAFPELRATHAKNSYFISNT